MPAASISRARPRSSAMCVLQIGQSTNRRSCRWTRRLGSGSLIGSPVTDTRVVAGTISPGLNFMFIHSLFWGTVWSYCKRVVEGLPKKTGLDGPCYALASGLSSPLDVNVSRARKSEIRTPLLDRPRRSDSLAHRRGRGRFDLRAWRGTDEPRRCDGGKRCEQIAALPLLRRQGCASARGYR